MRAHLLGLASASIDARRTQFLQQRVVLHVVTEVFAIEEKMRHTKDARVCMRREALLKVRCRRHLEFIALGAALARGDWAEVESRGLRTCLCLLFRCAGCIVPASEKIDLLVLSCRGAVPSIDRADEPLGHRAAGVLIGAGPRMVRRGRARRADRRMEIELDCLRNPISCIELAEDSAAELLARGTIGPDSAVENGLRCCDIGGRESHGEGGGPGESHV